MWRDVERCRTRVSETERERERERETPDRVENSAHKTGIKQYAGRVIVDDGISSPRDRLPDILPLYSFGGRSRERRRLIQRRFSLTWQLMATFTVVCTRSSPVITASRILRRVFVRRSKNCPHQCHVCRELASIRRGPVPCYPVCSLRLGLVGGGGRLATKLLAGDGV